MQGDEKVYSNGIDGIIDNTNKQLNELLGVDILDIRDFTVSNIEICFNVWLEDDLVSEYIEVLSTIWNKKDDKRYKTFKGKKENENTSLYIKTKGDKENGKNTNRNINFYNKQNQLNNLQANRKVHQTDRERELTRHLLRLEVQLYYQYLYRHIGKARDRQFNKFLSLPLAYNTLVNEYKRFIGETNLDFYSYQKAKEIAEETNLLTSREKNNLINDMVLRYQRNNWRTKSTQTKYNRKWERLGVHPVFIPNKIVKDKGIHYLPNPIKLLDNKLEYYLNNAVESKYFILYD